MNANELADEVEMWGKDLLALNMKGGIPVIEGAKLLRQQQAEIEDLKNANRFIQNFAEEQHKRTVALEMRELTDEEIIEIGLLTTDPRFSHIESPLLLEFARAILRKAQK